MTGTMRDRNATAIYCRPRRTPVRRHPPLPRRLALLLLGWCCWCSGFILLSSVRPVSAAAASAMASAGSLRGRALQGDDNEKRPETNEDDDTATAENAPNDGNDGNAPNDGNDPNGGNAGNGAAAEEEEENDDAVAEDGEVNLLGMDFEPILLTLVWDVNVVDLRDPSTPFSIDNTELHGITGRHLLDALQAELGTDLIHGLDLTTTAGLPGSSSNSLPVTLSGQVVFANPQRAVGSESLTRIVEGQFDNANNNALDLFLFRLEIAEDENLSKVSTALVGEEALAEWEQQQQGGEDDGGATADGTTAGSTSTSTSTNDSLISTLLIVVIASVAVAILAVVCFAYCLVCRGEKKKKNVSAKALEAVGGGASTGDRASDAVRQGKSSFTSSTELPPGGEEYKTQSQRQRLSATAGATASAAAGAAAAAASRSSRSGGSGRGSRSHRRHRQIVDEVPLVLTKPTASEEDDVDEPLGGTNAAQQRAGNSNSNINYADSDVDFSVSMVDDGVSDFDMETLPPPVQDTDDEGGMLTEDEDNNDYYDTDGGDGDGSQNNDDDDDDDDTEADSVSDAGTSLYSYIPDDTSLSVGPSVLGRRSNNNKMNDNSYTKVGTSNSTDRNGTTMEKSKKKGLLWSVVDTLKTSYGAQSDNEGDLYVEDDYSVIKPANSRNSMLGFADTDNDDSHSRDSNSLLYGDDNASFLMEVGRTTSLPYSYDQDTATVGDSVVALSPEASINKKKQFEQLWKDDDEAEAAAAVQDHLAEGTGGAPATGPWAVGASSTPEKEAVAPAGNTPKTTKRGNTSGGAAPAKKAVPVVRAAALPPQNQEETKAKIQAPMQEAATVDRSIKELDAVGEKRVFVTEEPSKEAPDSPLVDWVPNKDAGYDDDEDNKRFLPMPTTLEATFRDANKSSAAAGSDTDAGSLSSGSSRESGRSSVRKGESVRKKRASNWGPSGSRASASSNGSVTSTDSAKFRSLLNQCDTNDAALVFSKKLQQKPPQQNGAGSDREESGSACSGSTATPPEQETSMTSCSSGQLKSLLRSSGSRESDDEDSDNASDLFIEVQKGSSAAAAAAAVSGTLKVDNTIDGDMELRIASESQDAGDDEDEDDDEDVTAPARSQDIMRKLGVSPQEEKKEDLTDHDQEDYGDDEDDGRGNIGYLPSSIRPSVSHDSKNSADGTVASTYSALSAAPSVDATVTSDMGWF